MSDLLRDVIPRLAGLSAQVLQWRPADFWGATPGELLTALTPVAPPTHTPPTRAEIELLIERDSHG